MWNHLSLISFPYCAGKLTDVSEVQRSVNLPRPAYPLLATSRGAPVLRSPDEFKICDERTEICQ
jgi:hypothetical protein